MAIRWRSDGAGLRWLALALRRQRWLIQRTAIVESSCFLINGFQIRRRAFVNQFCSGGI